MPRSSRHKSKHSSRDARDYSDSERDSSSKDRKSKEESSVKAFKESNSGEKRKLESNKDYNKSSGNGEYLEEYSSSSKRRKERVEDGVNDRWNGGDDDNNRGEVTKKSKEKSSSESKSRRRDESAGGVYVEIEDVVRKNGGKSEGKHRESSGRKEGREGGIEKDRDKEKERDRRGKEGKSDKLFDVDDLRAVKQVSDKTESNGRDQLQSPESENMPDRRTRRKRDGSDDVDKHQDDIGDSNDRRFSSREDVAKDGKLKDEKHKDDRYRDKYREDVDRESRHRDDKQRDEHAAKEHINSRSDDKHSRGDKDTAETKPKKYKPQNGDRDREREHDRDFDLGRDHDHESYQRDRDREHDRDHDRERERERERDRDHDRDWDWDRDRDHDRDRERERVRDRDRERERNLDYDGAQVDDRGSRYKDSRGRNRSPKDHDDYNDGKARGGKTSYHDMEKKSLSSNRVESDGDKGRSQSRQSHPENNRRVSPNTSSHAAADDFRQFKQEDSKYRDAVVEQRSKSISSREINNLPGSSDRALKYRSSEKATKMDDSHIGELSLERSSSSKASAMGLMDRSPSSSLERGRYMNRSSVRRSLDIEESGRRRDLSSADDRPSRDVPLEKSLADESTSVDSSFYNRNNQSNSTLIPPSSAFRGSRVGSPSFMGSLDDDGRINTGTRYKRSSDPNLGRGQGNAWRGVPNWSSPLPNGYLPFQHGPPHGGFQAMMPQFPSPLPFGVRPSMEINHSGIPYHIADADRFSAHLRPFGWQNMMDGSGHSHMHGWDGNNGVFRDEAQAHIYGRAEWDQNRHSINGQGWENSADLWKGQNGDVNLDLPLTTLKEDFPVQSPADDVSAGQGVERSQNESNHLGVQAKTVEKKQAVTPLIKESLKLSPKRINEKTPDPPRLLSTDNVTYLYHAYLSKLDISIELADPELYNQCTSLLNIEHCVTADQETAMLVNLKDGARAIAKSSSTLLNSSLFPMMSDSVFQRAMDIYKRQRVGSSGFPIAEGGIVDSITASKIEEPFPDNDADIKEEQILNHTAEMSDVQMMDLDENKVEADSIADVQENLDETIPIADVQGTSDVAPSQEAGVDAHAPELKLESSEPDIPGKPLIILGGNMDGVPSRPVDSESTQEDLVSTPENGCNAVEVSENVSNTVEVYENVPNDAKDLSTDGHDMDDIGEIKGSDSFNCAEEGQGFGDAICGPLLFEDGSPKVSGDLLPGSNESESVILSRIHHSPESTH